MKSPAKRETRNPRPARIIPAAVGFRAHSGWAALVMLAGPLRAPTVVVRTRIELIDPAIPGSKQPYHAARELDGEAAAKHVQRCADTAKQLADQSLRALLREWKARDHEVAGAGLVLGSGRPLPDFEMILGSHPLLHTAEGQLFRQALAQASERCGLTVTGVKERELFARAEAALRIPAGQLQKRLNEMGKIVGSPWRQDEKYSALVAWMALASASR